MATTPIIEVLTAPVTRLLTLTSVVREDYGIGSDATDSYLSRLIKRNSASVENFCNRVFARQRIQESILILADAYPYQLPGGVSPLQLSYWPLIEVESVYEFGKELSSEKYRALSSRGQLVRLDYTGNPMAWPTTEIVVIYSAGYELPLPDWEADTAYSIGDVVVNDACIYSATVAGTSASSGGPTGTDSSITDGTVTWSYVRAYERTLPYDIEDAVGRLVFSRYLARRRDPFIKSETTEGVGSVSYIVGDPTGEGANFPPDVMDLLNNYRVPVVR